MSMTFLVAPQPFKGTLSARQAAEAMRRGVLSVLPDATIDIAAIADGGGGTVDALLLAKESTDRRATRVHHPMGELVDARWGLVDHGQTAVLEMAQASGLTLVPAEQREVLDASTFGTGELIRAALDANVSKILLGLGDSATCDGGLGALHALGVRFFDAKDVELKATPRNLLKLARVDVSGLDPRLSSVPIELLCDVRNTLLGDNGAARVYGPQKGADPDAVEALEDGLERLVSVFTRQLGSSAEKEIGSGAGGGLGYGLASVCKASLKRGFDVVSEAMGLFSRIAEADVVLTGEGRIDAQTTFSKGPWALGRLAKMQNKRVVAFAGEVRAAPSLTKEAFDEVVMVSDPSRPLPSPSEADAQLEGVVQRWALSLRPRASRDDLPVL